jgi:hypothetical protein
LFDLLTTAPCEGIEKQDADLIYKQDDNIVSIAVADWAKPLYT